MAGRRSQALDLPFEFRQGQFIRSGRDRDRDGPAVAFGQRVRRDLAETLVAGGHEPRRRQEREEPHCERDDRKTGEREGAAKAGPPAQGQQRTGQQSERQCEPERLGYEQREEAEEQRVEWPALLEFEKGRQDERGRHDGNGCQHESEQPTGDVVVLDEEARRESPGASEPHRYREAQEREVAPREGAATRPRARLPGRFTVLVLEVGDRRRDQAIHRAAIGQPAGEGEDACARSPHRAVSSLSACASVANARWSCSPRAVGS